MESLVIETVAKDNFEAIIDGADQNGLTIHDRAELTISIIIAWSAFNKMDDMVGAIAITKKGKYYFLDLWWVKKEYRGTSVSTKLIEKVKTYCFSRRINLIYSFLKNKGDRKNKLSRFDFVETTSKKIANKIKQLYKENCDDCMDRKNGLCHPLVVECHLNDTNIFI